MGILLQIFEVVHLLETRQFDGIFMQINENGKSSFVVCMVCVGGVYKPREQNFGQF